MKDFLVVALVLMTLSLNAQCFEDRHNTSMSSSWLSCDESENPNPERDFGHWIQYDLGETKVLKSSKIWNLNAPEHLNDGAKNIIIDYSYDGIEWIEWGTWELAMAEGSGFYEGVEGPDFEDLSARYILISIAENHGGTCYGLGELKVFYKEFSSIEDVVVEQSRISIFPNPATSHTELNFDAKIGGQGRIQILTLAGKEVSKMQVSISKGEQNIRIPLASITEGQYIIRLAIGESEYSTELTKIRNH